jgi:hypothetical protein
MACLLTTRSRGNQWMLLEGISQLHSLLVMTTLFAARVSLALTLHHFEYQFHFVMRSDLFCAGKTCFLHSGNKRFRKLVSHYLDRYSDASTKLEKSAIVSTIIGAVRSRSPNGGFVKLDPATGRWQEVGDYLAREKVGQTMRDALHGNYKSSTKAKKMRRQAEQAKADDSLTHITNAHCTIASKIEDLMRNVVHSRKYLCKGLYLYNSH